MSDQKKTFVRSDSPDELYKSTMVLYYLKLLITKNNNMIDLDDVKRIIKYMDDDEALKFTEEITLYLKKSFRESGRDQQSTNEPDYISYDEEKRFKDDRIVNNEVRRKLSTLLENNLNIDEAGKQSEWYKKITDIAKIFKLTAIEFRLLQFLCLYESDSEFSNIIDGFVNHNPLTRRGKIDKRMFATILEIGIAEVAGLFSSGSNLVKYGLLDDDLDIESSINSFLEGLSGEPFTSRYYKIFEGETIDIADFSVDKRELFMIEKMLSSAGNNERGFKILLYGKPGTGKTEFARSMCKYCNFRTYELKQLNRENESSSDDKFRLQGLYAFKAIAADEPTIMIIDEADGFLSSRETGLFGQGTDEKKKGIINSCLDELKYNQIWVLNNAYNLDESTKRRFDYCIEFSDFSFNQRKNIWKNTLGKSLHADSFDENDLNYLTDKYQVNAGIIAKAVENCTRIYKPDIDKKEMIAILEDSLNSHINLLTGRKISDHSNKEPNFSGYSIEGLNIKGDLNSHLALLDRFNTAWENDNAAIRNMNVLMWGPPGTGKTELAKYIARRLKRKLIVKTASDILDKYVGGTEENIAAAFKEAEREKGLLFIDEIDGLLANRGNAQRTWEVTQVNELLVRMENHNGILLCATNFIDNVDTAATRRFNIKIEFDYLNESGVDFFYNLFFGKLNGSLPDETQRLNLKSIKYLTPGDFKVVYQKVAIFGDDKIDPAAVIGSLSDEVKLKNKSAKRIGF